MGQCRLQTELKFEFSLLHQAVEFETIRLVDRQRAAREARLLFLVRRLDVSKDRAGISLSAAGLRLTLVAQPTALAEIVQLLCTFHVTSCPALRAWDHPGNAGKSQL